MAYEEPKYQVIEIFADFELRQYEPYVVAETFVTGEFSDVGSPAFRRLFAYISEDDRPQGKIAMTTPVIQQPASPVAASGNQEDSDSKEAKSYRFAFVMPEDYTLESLPLPENTAVTLREVPARLMAVRRYSGTWSEARYRQNEKRLLDAIRAQGLDRVGEPLFARYNAPFSLWFLRRNEVLVEIRPQGDQ
ncbi:MAG: heme-binding protein [Desulfuromonadales bacterium]